MALQDLGTWVKPGEVSMQTVRSSARGFPGWMVYNGRNVLVYGRRPEQEVEAWLTDQGYVRHEDYMRQLREGRQ